MTAPMKPVAAWFLAVMLAANTVFLASKANPDSPFLVFASLGAVVIQIRTCRRRLELAATVPPAVASALVHFGPHVSPLYKNPAGFGLFLGLASLSVMGVSVSHGHPHELWESIASFEAALALPFSCLCGLYRIRSLEPSRTRGGS